MSARRTATTWRCKLLDRGERGVASMGIAMAAILIICCAANTWLSDSERTDAAAEQRLQQLRAVGPLLSQTSQRLIANGDLAGLHKLASTSARGLGLGACSISLGSNQIIADMVPSRITEHVLPDHWTTDGSGETSTDGSGEGRFRFAFVVPGRGAGFVEAMPAGGTDSLLVKTGPSALICALGLCVLVLVYRRSRHGMAEIEVIKGSLNAISAGESSVEALQVDDRLGPAARAWNNLLTELQDLRRRSSVSPVAAATGNRRAGGNNLEAACDAMSQGLILVDDKMRVRFSNGAACTFLKHDRTSLAGTAAEDMVKEPKFSDAIHAIADGKLRRPVTVEVEQPSESGNGVLRFCIRPVRRGDADSAMIIIEDITQQRTAERARNTFINQVTHELRTPLTNIRLYAETAIEDGESDPEVRANCLNVINQESRRLERIVSEMLSVAEIEAGCSTVHRDEVYFDVLIKELHGDYLAQAQEKQITLEFNLSPKLPKLQADKDKLAIAMHNLIGNALKYTPAGGKVKVTVDVRDGHLAIDVADTGIGIKPEESEKIFDRFFRSTDPRVGKIVGTGLGLTLAREVMRLHGGDITVQSVIDRGSTFTASMPVNLAA